MSGGPPPIGYGRTPPLGLTWNVTSPDAPLDAREADHRATEWLYDWVANDPEVRAGCVAQESQWSAMHALASDLFRTHIIGIELSPVAEGTGYVARLLGYRDPQSGVYHMRYGPGGVGDPCGALQLIAEEIGRA